MTEIIWTSNGQGAFDFDYLLNLTNQEFVDFIEKSIIDFRQNVVTIKVQNDDQVKVFVVGNDIVHIHVFSKILKSRRSYFLNRYEIDWIAEVMQSAK